MLTHNKNWMERYGDWAVVTGASDGIGRAMAIELAARGVSLLLVARRHDRLEAIATELRGQFGTRCRVVSADLGNSGGIDAVMAEAAELDVGTLVAAAGFGTSGSFIRNQISTELEMVDVNCRAMVALAHYFGRRFAERKRGAIVLMSSLLAFQGVPRASNYAATKAFVQTFAEGLRIELRPHGVDVIASAPGPVRSGFEARANMRLGQAADPSVVANHTLDALGRKTTVRPGGLAKLLEAALNPLPRNGRVRIMQAVMAGITRHQNDGKEADAARSA
jgi:short-subunit dehydrogenase